MKKEALLPAHLQYSFFSRNTAQVTPKNIYIHCNKYKFQDQSIQNMISFSFGKKYVGHLTPKKGQKPDPYADQISNIVFEIK